jgi:hypothetical protein
MRSGGCAARRSIERPQRGDFCIDNGIRRCWHGQARFDSLHEHVMFACVAAHLLRRFAGGDFSGRVAVQNVDGPRGLMTCTRFSGLAVGMISVSRFHSFASDSIKPRSSAKRRTARVVTV